jgi:serine/threonine protein kinase
MQESLFNYSIMKVLGEGGMSRVYLGYNPITHQKVAIKELLPNLAHSKDLRERFRREAQIMAKLDHPNIVKLIRYEETATSFYLIMEYVDGMDLEQHIKDVTGPISEPKAIEIMSTLLDALGYAHEKGVVHRDIKPANILITRDGKIKVLDFGIAKIVDENASGRTQTGARIGTVAYMSPEQVNAAPDIDLRTDIYSLGVMLHQMITGKAAYDTATSSDFEVQTLIVKEPLPRANSIYPYASEQLQKLIDKATQKQREDRFQDCDQFKLALLKKNQKSKDIPEVEQTPPPSPPTSKNNNTEVWVLAIIFIIFFIGFIIYKSNKESNSGDSSGDVVVDTTAIVIDTTAVIMDTTAVVVDTAAVVVDNEPIQSSNDNLTTSNSSSITVEQFREDYNVVSLFNSGTEEWGEAQSENNTFVFNYNSNGDVKQYLADGSIMVYTNLTTNARNSKTKNGTKYQEINIRNADGNSGILVLYESGNVMIGIGDYIKLFKNN